MKLSDNRVRILLMLHLYGYSALLLVRWQEDRHEERFRAFVNDPQNAGHNVDINDDASFSALAAQALNCGANGIALKYAAE
jgi:hypothetical protein